MVVPKLHQQPDRDASLMLMESRALGAWVCHCAGELVANHVPFLLDRTRGQRDNVPGSFARVNGGCKQLTSTTSSVVVFRVAKASISPG